MRKEFRMCTQGARIRKARKNLQLSLQQLGQVLNVSKQYLSKIVAWEIFSIV